MSYKVIVDVDRCEANALCMAYAPDVFELDDDDLLVLKDARPGDLHRPLVEDAAAHCPRQAIAIVGD